VPGGQAIERDVGIDEKLMLIELVAVGR